MSQVQSHKTRRIHIRHQLKHHHHDQEDNFFYEILKKIITIEKVTGLEHHKGIPLNSYQYKADVLRLEKLIERGGIYMDLDVLSLKPLDKFLNNNIVMGAESAKNNETTNIKEINSITNAIIITKENNDFLKCWYDQLAENLIGKEWAYHAVCLPKEIIENGEFDMVLEPTKTFMPFCFRYPYIFKEDQKDKDHLLTDSHTIHLWETIWSKEWISKLDVQYFNEKDNLFTKYFGDYMEILFDNLDILKNILDNCYKKNKIDKLVMYSNMYVHLCERFNRDVEIDILAYRKIGKIVTQYH